MKDWSSCMIQNPSVPGGIPTIQCLDIVFENILTSVIGLAGIALFVMLVIGGYKFLTSGGDPKKTAGAKQTMTYAVVGIGLLALAFVIFKLIESFTGVSVLNFEIPTN